MNSGINNGDYRKNRKGMEAEQAFIPFLTGQAKDCSMKTFLMHKEYGIIRYNRSVDCI
jgi:hypothetical protein